MKHVQGVLPRDRYTSRRCCQESRVEPRVIPQSASCGRVWVLISEHNEICYATIENAVLIFDSSQYQSQNAKRASSQKRHMVISIFLLCNSLILMSIGAGSIRAIKGGLDKVFKIRDRLHRICRQILR